MDVTGLSPVSSTDPLSASRASASTSNASSQSSSDSSSSTTSSQVYYSSPVVTVDAVTGALIEEWRDSQTGNELYQSPTRTALLYGQAQSLAASKSSNTGASGINPASYGAGKPGQTISLYG